MNIIHVIYLHILEKVRKISMNPLSKLHFCCNDLETKRKPIFDLQYEKHCLESFSLVNSLNSYNNTLR